MEVFDFANASFTKSGDGQWRLDRDWTKHAPTQIEIEVLFAHCMLLDQLLAPLLRHVAAGNLITADGLENSTFEDVMRWLVAVHRMMSPRALSAEAMQTASVGASE